LSPAGISKCTTGFIFSVFKFNMIFYTTKLETVRDPNEAYCGKLRSYCGNQPGGYTAYIANAETAKPKPLIL
jgi:hypothetical protein